MTVLVNAIMIDDDDDDDDDAFRENTTHRKCILLTQLS